MQTTAPLVPGAASLGGVRQDLLALAGRLRGDSAEVRGRAAAVAGVVDITWRSPAADLYRSDIGDRVQAIRAAADVLDDLATAVQRLAASAP